MNVDTQFPQAAVSTLPTRPVQARPDQVSARPVDRPHHDEPTNNQTRPDTRPSDSQQETRRPDQDNHNPRQATELSAEEKRELEKLQARDREVRAHEAAHKNAAGHLARGGAQFEFQTGPDGRRYAVGGEVEIDTSKVPGDPQATINKAQTIRRAATAPAEPSAQDRAVAAEATRMEAEARRELEAQRHEEQNPEQAHEQTHSSAATGDARLNRPTAPAPVGELIDVLA